MNKLGAKQSPFDARTLRMARYLSPEWAAPAYVDYTNGVTDWGMMENDRYSCCTISACGHIVQSVTQSNVTPYTGMETPADAAILDYYSHWCGWNVNDPASDNGGYPLTVLKNWRNQGFDGHALGAFVSLQPQNQLHVKHAINSYGGVYFGLDMPVSAQEQDVWDVVANDGGLWGGHAVAGFAYYDTSDQLQDGLLVVSWGKLYRMTWAFWEKYCSESYALLLDEWLGALSRGPDGLDLAKINADLIALG